MLLSGPDCPSVSEPGKAWLRLRLRAARHGSDSVKTTEPISAQIQSVSCFGRIGYEAKQLVLYFQEQSQFNVLVFLAILK